MDRPAFRPFEELNRTALYGSSIQETQQNDSLWIVVLDVFFLTGGSFQKK
ncbi:hypothetical protein LEP1GSC036_1962 [Leptospira weilii str. 2006001853]|uniref:Uncharacterized protein n=1 Tax=Leptospira weilii str. 2006001853 TaxID=1001589 RepID=A0A828YWL2_9LEPT|nr:hypothetical protein [Leptospira weilii]EKR62624.1 hypothetical protein LEP1GSC036_1962 [Leptospira weilii str. 2006001853]